MADSTLRDFMLGDPLGRFNRETISIEVNERFAEFLPTSVAPQILGALSPFVLERPWRYWDSETVKTALSLLERDTARTIDAIRERKRAINRGLENLFRPAPVVFVEDAIGQTQLRGLVRLSNEYLPEYLRWAEHVFGNLIELYWSLQKKGGVAGKYDLHGAATLLAQKGLDLLLVGYADSVRNAIAHGKISFTGLDIEFGSERVERFSPLEFLRRFDELCRTCNGLGVGILLFWARNSPGPQLGKSIPPAIIARFAAGGLSRPGLELLGTVESNTQLVGRQLHIAVRMSAKSRIQVLGDCGRIATQLLDAGAVDYDRFLFEIDHHKRVNSLVIILPEKLKTLLDDNAPLEHLTQAFVETQLLWFDETRLKTRLRMWQTLLFSGIKYARLGILKKWQESGLWIGKGRYRIRKIQNISVQGISRVRITAVLRNPSDAENRKLVREIVYEIVKAGRSRFVESRRKIFGRGILWPKRPSYVFVDLFGVDGTLRWLGGGGWQAGNLVAVAERVWGQRKPILVDNPEELYKGIYIRYHIDNEKAKEVIGNILKLAAEVSDARLRETTKK